METTSKYGLGTLTGSYEIRMIASVAEMRRYLRGTREYEIHSRQGAPDGTRSGYYVVTAATARYENRPSVEFAFVAADEKQADRIYQQFINGK